MSVYSHPAEWKTNPAIRGIIQDALDSHRDCPDLQVSAILNELNRGFYKIVADPLDPADDTPASAAPPADPDDLPF